MDDKTLLDFLIGANISFLLIFLVVGAVFLMLMQESNKDE